jgi:hypothetical protein
MPNDWMAAILTSNAGTHIFVQKPFIQDGKVTNNQPNTQIGRLAACR